MNYIGSKQRLMPFINEVIRSVVNEELEQLTFCDLFAGSGVVGRYFKAGFAKVISNDIEYYSYAINRHYIQNNFIEETNAQYLDYLNALPGQASFIHQHYCKGGSADRQYFSDENGMKIDAIRLQLKKWQEEGEVSEATYFHLLAALLIAADKVANTASVYGAYLKHLKKTAQQPLQLLTLPVIDNKGQNEVFHSDSNELISSISGDVLYLDPPYNARQYGANYHLLNTIALYDNFVPKGKTGLRDYKRSNYCKKGEVLQSFERLIQAADFKYIFLSYNNEGLMDSYSVRQIMSKYGKYDLAKTNYQRFKADADERRNHKADKTEEYLHILVRQ